MVSLNYPTMMAISILQLLLQFTTTYQVNVFVVAKLNTCWDLLPPDQWLPHKTKGWWENLHWSLSHNHNDKQSSSYQPGSMGIVVLNVLSHRALKPRDDPIDLGHWCWVHLCGQHSHHIRIVSMYCPCKMDGALSMYQQHLHTLGCLKCNICPKSAILDDLAKELISWQDAGDTVIIATDFNKDICSDVLQNFFAKFGLYDVCCFYSSQSLPPSHAQPWHPPYQWYFCPSCTYPSMPCRIFAFGEGILSNHHVLWMDIPAGLLHLSHDEPW